MIQYLSEKNILCKKCENRFCYYFFLILKTLHETRTNEINTKADGPEI